MAADCQKGRPIKRSVPFKTAIKIDAEVVISVELVKKLEDGPRAESVEMLDLSLPTQAYQFLR